MKLSLVIEAEDPGFIFHAFEHLAHNLPRHPKAKVTLMLEADEK